MDFLKIIKWASLIFSFATVSTYFVLSNSAGNILVHEEEVLIDELPVEDIATDVLNTEPFEEVEVVEDIEVAENAENKDCKGLINAYEKQLRNNVHDVPESLRDNYTNCLEYGKPNPPEAKEVKNSKSSNKKERSPKANKKK